MLWRGKVLQISFHSGILNRKLNKSGKKGLFLDCGSNIGQGFEFFRKYYPNKIYDYILFEPNPYCYKELVMKYANLVNEGVLIKNVAIGVEDGKIDFYGLEEDKGGIYSVGGTVLPEHNSKMYTTPSSASLKVSSINFAEYFVDVLNKNEYSVVILKLDIEGGEYPVLESLTANNQVVKFETMYIEFHSQYMTKKLALQYHNKEKVFLKHAKSVGTRVIKWI